MKASIWFVVGVLNLISLSAYAGNCPSVEDDALSSNASKLVVDYVANVSISGVDASLLSSSNIGIQGLRANSSESLFLVQVDHMPEQVVTATVRCDESEGGALKIMGASWNTSKSSGVTGGNDYSALKSKK